MNATRRMLTDRQYTTAITAAAAHHAVGVHESEFGPLTPFGLGSSAASMAYVLIDETHPNHEACWERCVDKGWLS